MQETTILFLCDTNELNVIQQGYATAFRKLGEVICWGPLSSNARYCDNSGDLIAFLERAQFKPKLILHPEAYSPFLPWGLSQVDIPSACFQIDAYFYTRRRIRWSMLFDYCFVFHQCFYEAFRRAGHPRTVVLTHAIDKALFEEVSNERIYEVGWVGHFFPVIYKRRSRIIPRLAEKFRMNEWQHEHSQEEMAMVYKSSKVVVNVSRDDFPQESNMRAFETMAAGALSVCGIPTELTEWGFREGEHFVAYRDEKEINGLVSYYLAHELERKRIAEAGRQKVLKEHTYDKRVETILESLQKDKGELFAPARSWPQGRLRLVYIDYYTSYLLLDSAVKELYRIKKCGFLVLLKALMLFAKAVIRVVRNALLR
jgi:spore maturation protein CgeB